MSQEPFTKDAVEAIFIMKVVGFLTFKKLL